MKAEYPNLELLEYIAKQFLLKDEAFQKKKKEVLKQQKFFSLEFDVVMFPQIWGSTCGGIDVNSQGEPVISGMAMTKQYTTVFHEHITDSYIVFFGNQPAYRVHDAKKEFLTDLKKQSLKPLSEAKKMY